MKRRKFIKSLAASSALAAVSPLLQSQSNLIQLTQSKEKR
ncbi:MAG: twin-arginine translocation signal domain-containing protein, partial [Ignavibacteriae bacterium]|nr:twin-arginine translocation signal domain-containing protein [Ignavibacteriota bacterium]